MFNMYIKTSEYLLDLILKEGGFVRYKIKTSNKNK